MPAILLPVQYDERLDPPTPVPELLGMGKTLPAEPLEAVKLNKVADNGPECSAPAA